MKFEPKNVAPVTRAKRVSRTYRLKPDTIILIQQAVQNTHFQTATALIEEAATQFAEYILKEKQ